MCFLCQFSISFYDFKNLKKGDKVYFFDRNYMDLIFYKTNRLRVKAFDKLKYTILCIHLDDLSFYVNSTQNGSSIFKLEKKLGKNCWGPVKKNYQLKDSDLVGWRGPIILESIFKKYKSLIYKHVRKIN